MEKLHDIRNNPIVKKKFNSLHCLIRENVYMRILKTVLTSFKRKGIIPKEENILYTPERD